MPLMHPGGVWYGRGAASVGARCLLWPLSLLYACGWAAYFLMYRLGIKKAVSPHVPIVCIGNLQVGGSGKTPTALYVARVLKDIGREVVLNASGYGAPRSKGASLTPNGVLSAEEWGDEPAMIRWLAPELRMIVGRDRVLAAKVCHERYPTAVLVLDDGFQHLPLAKHVSILLDESERGNTFCLPAGPYREPRWGRSRASLVIPGEFRLETGLAGFLKSQGTETVSAGEAKAKVVVLCALGSPESFVESVRGAGLTVERAVILPDHDPMDAGNLLSQFEPGLPIVVTAKDWVKLRERTDVSEHEFWIADYDLRIEPASRFRDWLHAALKRCEEAQ